MFDDKSALLRAAAARKREAARSVPRSIQTRRPRKAIFMHAGEEDDRSLRSNVRADRLVLRSRRSIMSRFFVAGFVGLAIAAAVSTSASAYHCLARALTEHRLRRSASSSQGPSQFQCAGAYTAAVGLVAKSYGAVRTRTEPPSQRTMLALCPPVTSRHGRGCMTGVARRRDSLRATQAARDDEMSSQPCSH